MQNTLIVLVLGLLAVGCGESDAERLEQEKRRLKAQLESKKYKADVEAKNKKKKDELAQFENKMLKARNKMLKARKEAESQKKKDDLLRLDVLGKYEYKDESGDTYKRVFLKNGIVELYGVSVFNGKKLAEYKWSISNGEIHVDNSGFIDVFRINKDKSITTIERIRDGKRTDYSEDQTTFKKIK